MQRALRAAGQDVVVATSDDDGRGRRLRVALATPVDDGVGPQIYFRKWAEPYKLTTGLAGWLSRNASSCDVMHVHALFSYSSTVAAWIAVWRDVPLVLRPLGTLSAYGVSQRRPLLKQISLAVNERLLLRRAAAVHCTSEAEEAEVRTVEPRARTVVIPLAVEFSQVERAVAVVAHPQLAARRVILFLSRLDRKKNIETVLDAWAAIANEYTDAVVVIAGSGDEAYAAELKARAVALAVGDRVLWAGYVDGDSKAALLQLAHVFVLPSFSENFGISVAEALAAGVPCILSPGVALASDVAAAGAGLVVEPSAAPLADAMRKYLDDNEMRNEHGRQAAQLARRDFAEDVMARRLCDLYARLAEPASRRNSR